MFPNDGGNSRWSSFWFRAISRASSGTPFTSQLSLAFASTSCEWVPCQNQVVRLHCSLVPAHWPVVYIWEGRYVSYFIVTNRSRLRSSMLQNVIVCITIDLHQNVTAVQQTRSRPHIETVASETSEEVGTYHISVLVVGTHVWRERHKKLHPAASQAPHRYPELGSTAFECCRQRSGFIVDAE